MGAGRGGPRFLMTGVRAFAARLLRDELDLPEFSGSNGSLCDVIGLEAIFGRSRDVFDLSSLDGLTLHPDELDIASLNV
jgi:hypothetical protein